MCVSPLGGSAPAPPGPGQLPGPSSRCVSALLHVFPRCVLSVYVFPKPLAGWGSFGRHSSVGYTLSRTHAPPRRHTGTPAVGGWVAPHTVHSSSYFNSILILFYLSSTPLSYPVRSCFLAAGGSPPALSSSLSDPTLFLHGRRSFAKQVRVDRS